MSNELKIGDVTIHLDENGLFCLNDIHRAAIARGILQEGDNSKRPSNWSRYATDIIEYEISKLIQSRTVNSSSAYEVKNNHLNGEMI